MIARRHFVRASAAALGFGVSAGGYSWRVEPHWVEIVERRLPVARLPADLTGSRLVQLSEAFNGGRKVVNLLRVLGAQQVMLEVERVLQRSVRQGSDRRLRCVQRGGRYESVRA